MAKKSTSKSGAREPNPPGAPEPMRRSPSHRRAQLRSPMSRRGRARYAGRGGCSRRRLLGVHTLCAVANFPITGVSIGHFPELVRALALVKQAAARANRRLGQLSPAKADAIDRACEVIAQEGRFLDQFVVDAVQGGAGTSTNMNANEVIANVGVGANGQVAGRLRQSASQR